MNTYLLIYLIISQMLPKYYDENQAKLIQQD